MASAGEQWPAGKQRPGGVPSRQRRRWAHACAGASDAAGTGAGEMRVCDHPRARKIRVSQASKTLGYKLAFLFLKEPAQKVGCHKKGK